MALRTVTTSVQDSSGSLPTFEPQRPSVLDTAFKSLFCLLLGQSPPGGGAAGSHHLRGQVRQAEGRPGEVCEGQGGAGTDGHGTPERQRRARPGTSHCGEAGTRLVLTLPLTRCILTRSLFPQSHCLTVLTHRWPSRNYRTSRAFGRNSPRSGSRLIR